MTGRLVVAIISTLLEEVALVIIVLFGLPRVGIDIPLPVLIAVMVAWLAWSVTLYQIGSRALRREPVISVPHMVGSKGKVVTPLVPDGLVRIKGELWVASSDDKEIDVGAEVIVVEQDGLKLLVCKSGPDNLKGGVGGAC